MAFKFKLIAAVLITIALIANLWTASNGAFLQKSTTKWHNGRSEFMQSQRKIFALFRHIYSPNWNAVIHDTGKHFEVFNPEYYGDLEVVNRFLRLYLNGFLKKGDLFRVTEPSHLEEVKALVELYKTSNDLKTVFEVAAWARNAMNEELFVYSTLIYFIHYTDEEFDFPAIYEINPYKFINSDVIRRVHEVKQRNLIVSSYTISSAAFAKQPAELSYFTEDLDLNSYYFYLHLSYPFWMNETLDRDDRGALFLYEHQQLLARYNLERFSVGIPAVSDFDFDQPFPEDYQSYLGTVQGFQFASRSEDFKLKSEFKGKNFVALENRLMDSIDRGVFRSRSGNETDLTKAEAINTLGNLIEGNVDSPDSIQVNQYFQGLKDALSGRISPISTAPLQHYETSLRDSGFFSITKRMLKMAKHFQNLLPSYEASDLRYDGVNITHARITDLETFFTTYNVDITNAWFMEPEFEGQTGAREERNISEDLWHKKDNQTVNYATKILTNSPFYYEMRIDCDANTTCAKTANGIVRVFLGPAPQNDFRGLDWDELRDQFFQVDLFKVNLRPGVNNIKRISTQFNGFAAKPYQFADAEALNNLDDPFEANNVHAYCGFPLRMLLPRSIAEGRKFMFYFIVSPPTESSSNQPFEREAARKCKSGKADRRFDGRSFGFPFDRPIVDSKEFVQENCAFRKAKIIHKSPRTQNL